MSAPADTCPLERRYLRGFEAQAWEAFLARPLHAGAGMTHSNTNKTQLSLLLLTLLSGCADDKSDAPDTSDRQQQVTYWDDMAPLFAKHCNGCHQADGVAPFRLDDYASAKTHAALIQSATEARSMPPWGATADGSCQNFADSLALSEEQIERIGAWVQGGATEGTKRTIEQAPVPSLTDGVVYQTPKFVPAAVGGEHAEHDEYRCFLLDSGVDEDTFITAYEVTPGAPELVHHSILMIVDPNAPAGNGESNLERMQALDAESPERAGWPCFSGAGEGVEPNSSPVVWAPGQGVVEYPGNSGVPLSPTHKVVIQVHYNLADADGVEDQTSIKLRTAREVENLALFPLVDPFLASIGESQPETLAPGEASVKYSWQQTIEQMGLAELPELSLRGVMPHMHELGRKYRMSLVDGGEKACGVDVQAWDFHWQRMYFYEKPIALDARTSIEVTCDFDTSSRSQPVLPGWGTQNEMCLATLFVTVPLAALRRE
jgi:mono/diheme cytochrome c family protein